LDAVAQHHLNSRVSEHRSERNQINTRHRPARGPRVPKIVEAEVRNRTLICFFSKPIDARECADMSAIHFTDRLVSSSPRKKKITFDLLKPSLGKLPTP
jgi:hypothetical protein